MIRHPVSLALGLLALLAWAPLPFGSVTPWGAVILQGAGFVVLALALLLARPVPIPAAARRIALLLAAIALIGVVQSASWPAGLVRFASPEQMRIERESAALLERPISEFLPVSLAPAASRRAALAWLLGAAALLAGALLGGSRRARRALLGLLAASALFQVGFGVQQWMLRRTTLWGVELPWRRDGLRGTFVNPNHVATYLLIVGPALFALVWWLQRRRSKRHWLERGVLRLGPAGLLWIAILVGLALTGSRAGLVAGFAGVVAQMILVSFGGGRRRVLLAGAAVLFLATILVAMIGFRSGFDRLTDPTQGGSFRVQGMADTARLFTRFPLTGVGLGAFRAAFPLAHEVVGEEGIWWHAHNDWLELAATTGIVGFAIAIFGVVALARGLRQSWLHGERSEDRAAALAAIGACVGVGLQELLDFGLTIPANSVTLAVVCGAALAVPLKADSSASVAVSAAPAGGQAAEHDVADPTEPLEGSIPASDLDRS